MPFGPVNPMVPVGKRPAPSFGLLTLPAAMILLTLASLALLSAAHPLLVEMRSSVHHQRTVQALLNAEAGQAWALAALNAPVNAEAACRTEDTSAPVPWRHQVLFAPILPPGDAVAAISSTGVATSCARTADTWQCRCSTESAAERTGPDTAADPAPSDEARFHLSWAPGPSAWTGSLLSQACQGNACVDPSHAPLSGGRGAVRQSFSQLGAWRQVPPALLVAGTRLTVEPGVRIHLPPAPPTPPLTPRWALVAGQDLAASTSGLTGPPGTPTDLLMQQGASGLPSTLDAALRSLLGLPLAWWSRLPTVERVSCPVTGCTHEELLLALASGRPGIAVLGNLRLDAPQGLDLGTHHPVLLVVQGRLEIRARVHMRGVLMAEALHWTSPGASSLQGAAWSATTLALSGPLDITHDADALAALARATPAWVPVAGSWEDVTDD